MELEELGYVAAVAFGAAGVTALLVLLGIWLWRLHRVRWHGRLSRQRRYESTRIDLTRGSRGEPAGARERSRRSHRSRRSRRSHGKHEMIDLFRAKAGEPKAEDPGEAADGEPDSEGR